MKQADKIEVEDWINKYVDLLKPISKGGRGKVVYCFNDLSHYEGFKVEFKTKITDKFNLTKYGDLTMSGSVLTKINPPDLDLVMYMAREDIYELYKYYKKTAELAFERGIMTKTEYDRYIKGISNYYDKNGRIYKSYYIAIDVDTNKLLYLEKELLKLDIINTLNLSKTKLKDKFDFNIYSTSEIGRSIPPELTIKL